MQNNISESMPVLPPNKIVLVIGSESKTSGLKYLKETITELNRGGKEWIKGEFHQGFDPSRIKEKVGIILTMSGVEGSLLFSVRKIAEESSIHCPKKPLSISQAKILLAEINSARKLAASPDGSSNSDKPNVSGNNGHQALPADTPAPIPLPLASLNGVPAAGADNIAQSLQLFENLAKLAADAQVAALFVADEHKKLSAENERLAAELGERTKECETLRSETGRLQSEVRLLAGQVSSLDGMSKTYINDNSGLKSENLRLQGRIQKFEQAIAGFSQAIKP